MAESLQHSGKSPGGVAHNFGVKVVVAQPCRESTLCRQMSHTATCTTMTLRDDVSSTD